MNYDQITPLYQFLGVNWKAADCIEFSGDFLIEFGFGAFTRIVD